jgi:1-acyl-sn-glycerol-3-phosphate acyltransferase
MPAERAEPSPVALRSERMMAFFDIAFARSFSASFQALRVPLRALPDYPAGRPLVLLANHPSWWDGVMFMLLLRRLFPGRPAFFPMDAAALEKYRFMRKLGVFGIEQESARGAVRFLRTAKEVLESPSHMLWMNAPGRFADVRERPVPLAPGAVRLAEIAPDALIGTLAFDYTHWTEKRGEALAGFGPAVPAAELAALPREARLAALREMLTGTMDRLAEDAMSRDPMRFRTILEGRSGVGGVYGLAQYARAMLRGERFDPRHDPRASRGLS